MMLFNLIALIAQAADGNLGTFEPPSAPFGFKADTPNPDDAAVSVLERIISVGLGGITIVAALYFLFVFVMAAFQWISSAGDSGKIQTARDSMINGLIGMLIIVTTYAIMGVIGSVLGLDILNVGTLLRQLAPNVAPPAR